MYFVGILLSNYSNYLNHSQSTPTFVSCVREKQDVCKFFRNRTRLFFMTELDWVSFGSSRIRLTILGFPRNWIYSCMLFSLSFQLCQNEFMNQFDCLQAPSSIAGNIQVIQYLISHLLGLTFTNGGYREESQKTCLLVLAVYNIGFTMKRDSPRKSQDNLKQSHWQVRS